MDSLPHDAPGSTVPNETSNVISAQKSYTMKHPPQCPHVMRTCSMEGILKPKKLIVSKHQLPKAFQIAIVQSEPTCYSQAVKFVEWRAAMALEFDGL